MTSVPLPDLFVVAGVLLALIGVGMLSLPVALIVVGVLLAAVGVALHFRGRATTAATTRTTTADEPQD